MPFIRAETPIVPSHSGLELGFKMEAEFLYRAAKIGNCRANLSCPLVLDCAPKTFAQNNSHFVIRFGSASFGISLRLS
jgi:hypothetical protein